jgi:hypothetical protein
MRRDLTKLKAWRARSRGLARKKPQSTSDRPSLWSKITRRPQPTTGFRIWVRQTQVCAVPGCGRSNPDPHHVRARGVGRRDPWVVDHTNVAPLCREHHRMGEQPGWSWARFEDHFGLDLRAIAVMIWLRWLGLPEAERMGWEELAHRRNVANGVPARFLERREVS